MTHTPEARAETLARELESAFRNRADLYRLFYDELVGRFGEEAAEDVMIQAVEKRGQEVAALAFKGFGPTDARAIGEAFLAVSPDGGRMYPTHVSRRADGISFEVQRCPLKDAWVEAGVSEDRLATLCRIAGAFDRGLFEATGIRFENRTWTPGHGSGCCHIHLSDDPAKTAPTV
ncbi:L-2-amino-thiazoline-4-carboxylic acid hydrolase [Microvirga pudoricolor]|uniref:L-2-amino-thiazoline-4-carboxylic acid hydrolase n=1 Tax=Microvirga pudoricolor TaxID=2778729 RepID=UPI00194F99AD|nr:L-2-amino-thiazoline-4-carboxylic acid hydrolase [Microvirga pudoricolor]MBM6594074.1 L-2-amino-thiazoline-4-carboxylic acid hydrolase [Microvirga pudoricolor]